MTSIRTLDLDQNSLLVWPGNWSAANVGYVGKIIHEGPPNAYYPGGFSRMLGELRQRLPKIEWATYLSMAYLSLPDNSGFPRRCIAAEFFEAGDKHVDGNGYVRLNYDSAEACRKWMNAAVAECIWRRDMFATTELWIDDYPTPFDPTRLDFYVSWMAEVNERLGKEGIRTRLNASNLFYASQDDGALTTLAKASGGTCLEGGGLNEERKDLQRFNRRLKLLTQHQKGIEIAPLGANESECAAWCAAVSKELAPAFATGKVFLGWSHMWPKQPWC